MVVGGTYRKGWATWLVLDGGRSVRLGAPGFVFYNRMKVYGATGTSYWRDVAESPSGRQAVLIHAAAGLDGPTGPALRDHPLRGDLTSLVVARRRDLEHDGPGLTPGAPR